EAVIENGAPPQTVCVVGNALAEVSGFTVTLKVTAPARFVHPPKIGVTVNVVVCGVLVKLVRLPEITVPDPSGIPETFALVRVQLNVVPATEATGVTFAIDAPEQMIWLEIGVMVGVA